MNQEADVSADAPKVALAANTRTLPYTNNCGELRRDGQLSSGQLTCFSDTNTALGALKETEESTMNCTGI